MAKAYFEIVGNEENGKVIQVQHVGCRLTIVKQMIHKGFTKGGAFNLPTGEVRVVLEDDKEKIESFHKEVEDNLIEWLTKENEELHKKIGNPGIEVKPIVYDEKILVLDIGLYGHSLTFDQIYKGVDVYKELITAISGLNKTIKKFNGEK